MEQFTDRGTDYAILACIRADGTLQNMLLMLPTLDSGMAGYKLQGAPDKPFIIDVAQKPAQVMQAMDSPNSVRVWWLDNGLHGPKIVTMFFLLTFFSIGLVSNFRKLKEEGIGRLAVVYIVCLFGFIIWVGLFISYAFFHGMTPPVMAG